MEQNTRMQHPMVYYVRTLFKYRIIIFLVVFIASLVTACMTYFKPFTYQAVATFFPTRIMKYYDADSQISALQSGMKKHFIVAILESEKMANRIIEDLGLQTLWKAEHVGDARRQLHSSSNVSVLANGMVRLSVIATEPELAARIANSYIDNLIVFNQELNIGAEKQIVQVIDRASVPEQRMARGTIPKTFITAVFSFVFIVTAVFAFEFIKSSRFWEDIRNE